MVRNIPQRLNTHSRGLEAKLEDFMEEAKQDVKEVSSTSTEDVAVKPPESSSQEQVAVKTTEQVAQTPPAGQQDVDEQGIPWKNRAFEWKRKTEELTEKIPEIIRSEIQQLQTPKEQEYTVAQLEQYAQENPAYRPWVEEKKAELLQKKLTKDFDERLQVSEKQRQRVETEKVSRTYVESEYPNMFVKDASNRVIGINSKDPMVGIINQIMQDKRLSEQPDALAIAADIAYGRVQKMKSRQTETQQQQLKAEVKDLQKKTLVEAGGTVTQTVSPKQSALNRLRETGSIKDAQEAVREILKARLASKEQ